MSDTNNAIISDLRAIVRPEATIYLVKRKITRRGNTVVDFCFINNSKAIVSIARQISGLLGLKYDQLQSGVVLPRDSNAATHVVNALSRALFGEVDRLSLEWV